HVGYGRLELVGAAGVAGDEDRVVEIHGGLAVDRHDRKVPEILAPPDLVVMDGVVNRLRPGQRIGGKPGAQPVLPDDRLEVHPGLVRVPQDLDDPAGGRVVIHGGREDFDTDDHAVPGRPGVLLRDGDVALEQAV